MKRRLLPLTLIGLALGQAVMAHAEEAAKPPRVVSDAAVHWLSDMTYAELLRQAASKGWHYTPEQIASGYRRHFEEYKAQLMNNGYIVLPAVEAARDAGIQL